MPSAAIPGPAGEQADWMVFGVRQTGQLDKANGRFRDGIGIIERCEARDAAAVRRIEAPWWKRPFLQAPRS